MSSDTPKRGCEICGNSRGGVVGNEQIVDGTSMCDYCHADHLRFPRFWEDRFSTPRTDAAAVGFGRLLVDHGTPEAPKFTTTELVPADFARQLERELAAMTARAEAAERDGARLARLVEFVDGIGDIDLHEQAAIYASHRGNEEPDASDYLAAARDAIDAAREGK